jgi:hypothetical protein
VPEGAVVAASTARMKACVLVVASQDSVSALTEYLDGFEVVCTSNGARAALLASLGSFQAIVVTERFAADLDRGAVESPLILVGPETPPSSLPDLVTAKILENRDVDERGSYQLAALSDLAYSTYIELVRFRATRRYLLGLMRRCCGDLREASLISGIEEETLGRELRRHDVEVDAYRQPEGN